MKEKNLIKKHSMKKPIEIPMILDFNRFFLKKYVSHIPIGHENAIANWKIVNKLNELKEFEKIKLTSYAGYKMMWTAIVNYNQPIGTFQKGAFIIKTKKDKKIAINWLESKNSKYVTDWNSGQENISQRYSVIECIDI